MLVNVLGVLPPLTCKNHLRSLPRCSCLHHPQGLTNTETKQCSGWTDRTDNFVDWMNALSVAFCCLTLKRSAEPQPGLFEVELEGQSVQVHDQLVEGGVAVLQLVGFDPRHLSVLALEVQGVKLSGRLEAEAVFQQRGHPLAAEKRVLNVSIYTMFFVALHTTRGWGSSSGLTLTSAFDHGPTEGESADRKRAWGSPDNANSVRLCELKHLATTQQN